MKQGNWRKSGFEFLSIFIAVVSAFALNNWNENRKADKSENKILVEISNGLEKDHEDIQLNKKGHVQGIYACAYFRKILANEDVRTDSLFSKYMSLTRDFISIQNTAGYETLKSRGLELIKNDALRLKIISLYEFDYQVLQKLEEEYSEMQFQENYFKEINQSLAPNFSFDDESRINGLITPLKISMERQKVLLSYLQKIETNRNFILNYYTLMEGKVKDVQESIQNEIN